MSSGCPFPCDRIFAVEDGPSGFDLDHLVHVAKTRFAVLAKIAQVGAVRTLFDDTTGRLSAAAPGQRDFHGLLTEEPGRAAFAVWLTQFLGPAAEGPLRVIAAPDGHRFLDNPNGQVSIVNLASVRDLATRMGHRLDPLRFRANLYVEGWPAWAENDSIGKILRLGDAQARVLKPIVRWAATGVDPETALRDLDPVRALLYHLGHAWCGVYVQVTGTRVASDGDTAETI